jgi:predicted transcriptional regulator
MKFSYMRRVTVAIDENAEKTLQKLSKELGVSYSFLVRQAIKLLASFQIQRL